MLLGYLAAALIGLALFLVITGLGRRPAADVPDDTEVLDTRTQVLQAPLGDRATRPVRDLLVSVGSRLRPSREVERGLNRKLDAAGLSLPPEAFYALKAVTAAAAILLAILIALLTTGLADLRGIVGVVVAAVLGYLGPNLWLLHTRQARQQAIALDLPEGLDLLALTVRAGLGLEQGIAEVSREIPGPLGQELDRLLKEEQLGRTRREAIQAMKDRNPNEDLQRLTGALLHADKLGTPIGQTLTTQARELRRRRRARARERAGKAPVKLLVPLILFVFPAMFVVIIGPGVIGIIENLF